jgi:hypothetical protein
VDDQVPAAKELQDALQAHRQQRLQVPPTVWTPEPDQVQWDDVDGQSKEVEETS